MSFTAVNKYKLSINLNGVDLTPNNAMFSGLTITENAVIGVPVLELSLSLKSEFVESTVIADGSVVILNLTTLDSVPTEEVQTVFRVFNFKLRHANEYYLLIANCIYDMPDMYEGKYESFDDTSYKVFSTIANRSQLQFDGDPSTDKQVWIRPGVRGNIFLNDISQKAWSSTNSCYVYNVGRDNVLRYYDLSRRIGKPSKWKFIQNNSQFSPSEDPTQVLYGDITYGSNSGTYNRFFGYGRSTSSFDVDTGDFTSHKASSPTYSTKYLQMHNQMVKNQRSKRLPHNSGNTHLHYNDAIVQNLRYKSLYSMTAKVMTEFPRNFQVLDRVTLSSKPLSTSSSSDTYSGDYFISAVITQLDSGSITRTAMLVREGINPLDTANLRS